MSTDVTLQSRLGAVIRTLRWQLGLVSLGWWLWPTLVAGATGWAILISNQVQASVGEAPPIYFVLIRLLSELQAIPGLIGVLVVLVDDLGRSRHSSALALPWPRTLFLTRLAGGALLSLAWASATLVLGTIALTVTIPNPGETNLLTWQRTYLIMPLYSTLIALVTGSLAQLIRKVIPSVIVAVGGIGLIIPLLGIFFPLARYLPGVVGVPPMITIDPSAIPSQPVGLAILTLWAIGLTALALWKTTHQDC